MCLVLFQEVWLKMAVAHSIRAKSFVTWDGWAGSCEQVVVPKVGVTPTWTTT